ncbi:MAG: hypothetical protein HY906_11245 [Deltaproteobacteria bacterium]|nr:hypothetical protein [Deltaproteobacteria bacterium]
MAIRTTDDLYELIRKLPTADRLRLVERIVRDLSAEPGGDEVYDWGQLAGVASDLTDGEDAQAYVTRSRREADARRDTSSRGGR